MAQTARLLVQEVTALMMYGGQNLQRLCQDVNDSGGSVSTRHLVRRTDLEPCFSRRTESLITMDIALHCKPVLTSEAREDR